MSRIDSGHISMVFAEKIIERGDSVLVKYTDGTTRHFSAVDLACSWFRLSNDDFYDIYGFNYVPSEKIKKTASQLL